MLSKLQSKREQGFTIIEVLIVLAIAGLILLIVFLAVPQLQRNNRNTQLRNDAAVVLGLIGDFSANNNGAVPNEVCYDAATGIVGMENTAVACVPATHNVGSIRPSLTVSSNAAETGATATQTLVVNLGRGCNIAESGTDGAVANNRLSATANARAVAVSFQTERQGGTTNQCTES